MTLIWATRGRTWGFRFLRDGGFEEPRVSRTVRRSGAA